MNYAEAIVFFVPIVGSVAFFSWVGLLIGLRWIGDSVYMLGAIPLAIGIALFVLLALIDTGRAPAGPKA